MESLDSKYPCPSHVNVGNLTMTDFDDDDDDESFSIWKTQMMCVLESQDMERFVSKPPEKDETGAWRRTDMLVKGWILGSIGIDARKDVWKEKTAKEMWDKLDKSFGRKNVMTKKRNPNKSQDESNVNLKLYKAARNGEWNDGVKRLFLNHKNGFEAILNVCSETALHVAVMSEKTAPFVREVVALMPPEKLKHKDADGDTSLHCAAAAGNFEAVKALVRRNPDLPYILNGAKEPPVLKAAIAGKQKPLEFLISASKDYSGRGVKPFEGRLGLNLLCEVINSELFDVALKLVETYRHLAGLSNNDNYGGEDEDKEEEEVEEEEEEEKDCTCNADYNCALLTMAERPSAFRSGENFNWYQSFIYHCLLLKKSNRKVVLEKGFFGDVESRSDHAPASRRVCCAVKLEGMIWEAIKRVVPQVENMAKRIQVHERASKLVEKLCYEMIQLPEKKVRCMFLDSILLAAENGISEIVEKIIEAYPSVVFATDHKGRHVFQLAAKNRYENVFNIIYRLNDLKSELFDIQDYEDNNLMHMCGKLAPTHRLNLVPGAALQMQRELQWFKEMEKFVHPSRRTQKNKNDQTPQMVFTEKHKHLKKAGEKWMKETATACNIAATLIATVMFSAVFQLPDRKFSKFAFDFFGVSDAISLFTSITSMFMFISILTSRYAEEDFAHSLPWRLSLGLLTLFISIISMLAAFSATLYIIFRPEKIAWILILMAVFACLPVTLFVLLQFPLLMEVLQSTYGRRIFGNFSK